MKHIEYENNVEDDFTEDERTFFVTYFHSPWNKSFSSVSSTLIINIFYIIKSGIGVIIFITFLSTLIYNNFARLLIGMIFYLGDLFFDLSDPCAIIISFR